MRATIVSTCKADIAAWLPKVKTDGWLSGDDYDPIKWPEVVSAVKELLPRRSPGRVSSGDTCVVESRIAGRWRSGDRTASVGMSQGSEQRALDVAAPGQSPTVICTLGMHRSGTSLVSRILNLLGRLSRGAARRLKRRRGQPEGLLGTPPDRAAER